MPTRYLTLIAAVSLSLAVAAAQAQDKNPFSKENMTKLSMEIVVASEVPGAEGKWENPERLPPLARAGDRLWVQVDVASDAHVYVVGSDQGEYGFVKLAATPPGAAGAEQTRQLLPKGLVLSEAQGKITTVFVVASVKPVEWLDKLESESCPDLRGKYPPDKPQDACGHLASLYFKVPGRVRGPYEPHPQQITVEGRKLKGDSAINVGVGFVAAEVQVRKK